MAVIVIVFMDEDDLARGSDDISSAGIERGTVIDVETVD
jgi:hypothetical protein